MDFGIRELLMFIGALIFIGVLIDGVRRFQDNRKKQIKVEVNRESNSVIDDDEEDWYSAELPGGKARVKSGDFSELAESDAPYDKKVAPRFSEPHDILMEEKIPRQSVRNKELEGEELDGLLDSGSTTEPSLSTTNILNAEVGSDFEDDVEGIISPPRVRPKNYEAVQNDSVEEFQDEKHLHKDINESKENTRKEKNSRFSPKKPAVNQGDLFVAGDKEQNDSAEIASAQLPEEVLSVNVIAKSGQKISGQALLDSVQSFGLRFGDMDIFHRHENSSGQGPVIFSMANAINPGTFDIDDLPESDIKGVTFFMRLSQVNKRIFVLELMVDIAKRLSNQLGAELKDDTHSVLSSQTVTHYKSRIQEYERRHLGQVLRK